MKSLQRLIFRNGGSNMHVPLGRWWMDYACASTVRHEGPTQSTTIGLRLYFTARRRRPERKKNITTKNRSWTEIKMHFSILKIIFKIRKRHLLSFRAGSCPSLWFQGQVFIPGPFSFIFHIIPWWMVMLDVVLFELTCHFLILLPSFDNIGWLRNS